MTIPKIIHYFYDDIKIWEKNKHSTFRMCYNSWIEKCPDYKIMLWHDKMPEFQEMLKNSKFLRECYERRLWAFVADYVRYYALFKYGGIYIDTDVELLQNFDKYLEDGFFVSIEGDILYGKNIPEPAVMGGNKEHPVFQQALDLYNSDEIFNLDYPIANVILGKILKRMVGFEKISYKNEETEQCAKRFYNPEIENVQLDNYELYTSQKIFENKEFNIKIYPSEYFCPTWYLWERKGFTENTVSVHWNQSSWWQDMSKLQELKIYRHKNKFRFFIAENAKRIANLLVFWVIIKSARKNLRNRLYKKML